MGTLWGLCEIGMCYGDSRGTAWGRDVLWGQHKDSMGQGCELWGQYGDLMGTV